MIAWKFLAAGGVAPFTGERWPGPARVQACALEDLPYWFDDELWKVELDGSIVHQHRQLTADRARRVARIDGWPAAAAAFTAGCVERTREAGGDVGYLADAIRRQPYPGLCANIAAAAAAAAHGQAGYSRERAAQVAWLKEHLLQIDG